MSSSEDDGMKSEDDFKVKVGICAMNKKVIFLIFKGLDMDFLEDFR